MTRGSGVEGRQTGGWILAGWGMADVVSRLFDGWAQHRFVAVEVDFGLIGSKIHVRRGDARDALQRLADGSAQ